MQEYHGACERKTHLIVSMMNDFSCKQLVLIKTFTIKKVFIILQTVCLEFTTSSSTPECACNLIACSGSFQVQSFEGENLSTSKSSCFNLTAFSESFQVNSSLESRFVIGNLRSNKLQISNFKVKINVASSSVRKEIAARKFSVENCLF